MRPVASRCCESFLFSILIAADWSWDILCSQNGNGIRLQLLLKNTNLSYRHILRSCVYIIVWSPWFSGLSFFECELLKSPDLVSQMKLPKPFAFHFHKEIFVYIVCEANVTRSTSFPPVRICWLFYIYKVQPIRTRENPPFVPLLTLSFQVEWKETLLSHFDILHKLLLPHMQLLLPLIHPPHFIHLLNSQPNISHF